MQAGRSGGTVAWKEIASSGGVAKAWAIEDLRNYGSSGTASLGGIPHKHELFLQSHSETNSFKFDNVIHPPALNLPDFHINTASLPSNFKNAG